MHPLPDAGRAVVFCYVGLSVGGIVSGWLSQLLRSRKKVLALFVGLTAAGVAVYFLPGPKPLGSFYALCFALGVAGGYWSIFITVASEQFGTNLRATATTTVPNFVRGAVVPLSKAFGALGASMGLVSAGVLLGVIVLTLAAVSIALLDETYGRDLDFNET